jgi:dipeptidase
MEDKLNKIIIEQCNSLRRGVERLKELIDPTIEKAWWDLIHVQVAAEKELQQYQKMVAEAAAPYFEVK